MTERLRHLILTIRHYLPSTRRRVRETLETIR